MMDSVNGRAISRGYLKQRRPAHHAQRPLPRAGAHRRDRAARRGRERAPSGERWHAPGQGLDRAGHRHCPILTDRQFGVADLARLHAVAGLGGRRRARTRRPPSLRRHGPGRAPPARLVAREHRDGLATASPTTSAATARTRAAGTPAPECSTGGPARTAATSTRTGFWPTVDWYRLPGTTVSTKRLADNAGGEWGEPKPAARWVGGATDGEYAAIGQHLEGLGSHPEGPQVVVLRRRRGRLPRRRHQRHGRRPRRDGRRQPQPGGRRHAALTSTAHRCRTAAGRARVRRPAGRIWRATAAGSCPAATRARALREDRTGAWSDINTSSATERRHPPLADPLARPRHRPADAAYVYLLMPGAARARSPPGPPTAAGSPSLANYRARTGRLRPLPRADRRQLLAGGHGGPAHRARPRRACSYAAGAEPLPSRVSEPPRTGEPLEIALATPRTPGPARRSSRRGARHGPPTAAPDHPGDGLCHPRL